MTTHNNKTCKHDDTESYVEEARRDLKRMGVKKEDLR